MGYTLISDIIDWYKAGKINFSKAAHGNGAVSYRLWAYSGRKEALLHTMILELTESVPAPYGVFSHVRCLGDGTVAHKKPRKKYESEKGLAKDIYAHLKKTKSEPVWRAKHKVILYDAWGNSALYPDKQVALWSRGHHRGLVRYLEESCRQTWRINPYWNGEFFMYCFRSDSSADDIWNGFIKGKLSADLIVSYRENSVVWIEFTLRQADPDEEKRICRLVKEACDRHGVKPILENIDPSMMELGYEV